MMISIFILKSEQSNEEYMICGYIIKIDENKYEMTIEDEIINVKIENNLLYLTDKKLNYIIFPPIKSKKEKILWMKNLKK